MARYVHRFIPQSGPEHSLMDSLEDLRPGAREIAQLDHATAVANMGWADYAADISRAEFDAHPNKYVIDTLIVLYDAEDPDNQDVDGNFTPTRECWAGYLDEPVKGQSVVRLGASGFGKLPDRTVKHWLWADYDTDQYQPTGPESDFPYDSDDEIRVDIGARAIKAIVQRKTEFKHPTGHTKLQSDAEADDVKVDLGQVEGLKAGMEITISGNAGGSIIDLAEYAISQGYTVSGHPLYGGSGICDGKPGNHALNSEHCDDDTGTGGDALDINWPGPDEPAKLAELAAYALAHYDAVIVELHYPGMGSGEPHYVPDTDDHMHIAFSGSVAAGPAITRTVAPDWHEGNTTVKLTNQLGSARSEGAEVTWNPDPEGRWASSAVGYYSNVDLGGVRLDIDLPRGKSNHYSLDVFKATGPDGAKTVVENIRLNKHRDDVLVELGNNRDLVGFTFARDHNAETKNADHFVARVKPITYGPFTTAKVYETWKIVRDVFEELNIDVTDVKHTSTNGLPFKVMPGRGSDALDAQAAVEDMVWLIFGGADGPEGKFRKYGDEGARVWVITDPHAQGALESMPRYEKLHLAYAHDGGFEDLVTMTANPNALSGGIKREYPQVIFQGNRPPPLALAQSFGQPIIDYLNTERYFGQKNFVEVEDSAAPGVLVPPTRVRPGDKARHPQENDATLRIQATSLNRDGTVTTSYPETIPPLERALALRDLLLNRGARQSRATLAGLNLRKPVKARNIRGTWKRIETVNGEHRFDGHANWADVDEDISGRAIFMREYHIKWRYRDDDGELVTDDDDDVIYYHDHIKLDSLEDNVNQLPSRYRFKDIRNPHKWDLEFAIDSISMQHKPSGFTQFYSLGRPPMPDPPQPETLVQKVDQHTITIDFDCDDAEETDSAGDSMLARGVGWFKAKRYKNGVAYGKVLQFKSTHKSWKAPKHTQADTFTTEVWGVDARGKLSQTVSVTTGQGAPPAPSVKPAALTFDRGGKKHIRAKGGFTYAGVDPDFHVHGYVIEWQSEDHNPTDSDPSEHKYKRVPVLNAYDPQTFVIRGLKKNEKVRWRYYAQATKNGHLSGPSQWSDIQTVTITRKPKKPTQVLVTGKHRGILARWPHPDRWNDGTFEGWDPSEVAYAIVRLRDTNGNQVNQVLFAGDDVAGPVSTNHHYFPLTKDQAGTQAPDGTITWNNYKVDVEIFGWDELSDGVVLSSGSAHATSLTATVGAHTHTGSGHHHGQSHGHGHQHRHNHNNQHRHAHKHTHAHKHGHKHKHTQTGYSALELPHTPSIHGHQFQNDGAHQHDFQHAHGGQTGSTNGHSHNIPSVGNPLTGTNGGHNHNFNQDASHTHDHFQALPQKDTSAMANDSDIAAILAGAADIADSDIQPATDNVGPGQTDDDFTGTQFDSTPTQDTTETISTSSGTTSEIL